MGDSSFLGCGWAFPPTFELGGYCVALSQGEHNIQQSIDIILQTPLFSRSLQPEFGTNLQSFIFSTLDAGLQEEIIQEVKTALLNHEPRISVESVSVGAVDIGRLEVVIGYLIKETNSRHNHVYPFNILEGTHLAAEYRR